MQKRQKINIFDDNKLDRLADYIYEKVSNQTGIDIIDLFSHNEKKFIVKILQNDLSYIKNNYQTIDSKNQIVCFFLATVFSTSIEIIDFLIDCFRIDVYETIKTMNGHENCFSFMCSFSANTRTIKHLIDKYNIADNDLLKKCLYQACGYTKACCNDESNIDVIKYLVEEKKTNINIMTGDPDESNYFLMRAKHSNIDATIYLIQHIKCITDRELIYFIRYFSITRLKEIISGLHNYDRINDLLRLNDPLNIRTVNGYPRGCKTIIDEIKNPLMINPTNRGIYNISDPFLEPWDKYVELVDGLTGVVPIYPVDKTEIKPQCPDFSKRPDILFQCNDIIYYGERGIMYDSLIFLQDIHQNCNFDHLVVLNGKIPRYVINHYINASYTGQFALNDIEPSDISTFIKFIDQYPTTVISIDGLEQQIIQFFDDNKLNYMDFGDLKDIFIRYRLKYLYLHMHNKYIQNN